MGELVKRKCLYFDTNIKSAVANIRITVNVLFEIVHGNIQQVVLVLHRT